MKSIDLRFFIDVQDRRNPYFTKYPFNSQSRHADLHEMNRPFSKYLLKV